MILSLLILLSSQSFAEKPIYKSEEGVYYYKTKKKTGEHIKTRKGKKVYKGSDGAYYYETDDVKKSKDPQKVYGKPLKQKGKVSYYKRVVSEQTKSLSFQIVSLEFSDFISGTTQFETIYGTADGILFDYEWQKPTSVAKFGFTFSPGILFASGKGRFADNSEAREKYNLYVVPLVGKLRINFEYSDRQYVVPYIEAGAGVYGIMERRDDGDDSTSAYTPIFTAAGGFHFLLDWMNEDAISKLDNNYGVNHIWLNVSYHLVSATESDFDLSNNQLQFGLKFDY